MTVKIILRRKTSTLLLLTWMPSFLIVPNRLNSSSNCCGVALNGRFRTYMACASTLKMIRKNVRCSQLKSISSLATSLGFDDTFWILKAATLSVRTESWRISNHSGCRRGLFLWFWGCRPGKNCRSWRSIFFHDFYLEHNNKKCHDDENHRKAKCIIWTLNILHIIQLNHKAVQHNQTKTTARSQTI